MRCETWYGAEFGMRKEIVQIVKIAFLKGNVTKTWHIVRNRREKNEG